MSKSRLMSHDHDNKQVSSPLYDLPQEMRINEIYPHYLPKELCFFAQTSRKSEKETAFLRLLFTTVNAEPESYHQKDETRLAAIAILKRHPELLFREGTVTDHFGRKIKASPYRLFLGAGDMWALKQIHEEIIAKIKNHKARAKDQAQTKTEFQTQFPDYSGPWPLDPTMPEDVLYDMRNKEQVSQVIEHLKIIVAKITADPCNDGYATKDETTKAVANLCKTFEPKEGEVIKTGLHFPLGILKEIGKIYGTNFDLWTFDQLSYFSRKVIGGAEAALSAVDGQCVKSGLANFDIEKSPDRSDGLFCRRPKGIPENKAPFVGKLGRTMFVDPYGGCSCFLASKLGLFDWYDKMEVSWPLRFRRGYPRVIKWHAISLFMENKQRLLRAMQPRTEKSTHRLDDHGQPMRCVIL